MMPPIQRLLDRIIARSRSLDKSRAQPAAASQSLRIILPPASVERVEALRQACGAATIEETVSRALRTFESLVANSNEGSAFSMIDRRGQVHEVELMIGPEETAPAPAGRPGVKLVVIEGGRPD